MITTNNPCGEIELREEIKMKQEVFTNAFIEWMSGSATFFNDREILLTEPNNNNKISIETIEFLNNSPTDVIVRTYWGKDNPHSINQYKDGQLHGKQIGYYHNGQKHWEDDYECGKMNGLSLDYHMTNGCLRRMATYENGKFIEGTMYDINGAIISKKERQ